MNRLEQLCHPLLRTMCEFWSFANANAPIDIDDFRKRIQDEIIEIHEQCATDVQLKREFSRIEQPLIFFVDYTIKEGGFPFSRGWRELARDYNELSGDEKFFDLLAEALDDPDESERLLVFHVLMGLGFNGCHINDNEYIERRMKLCATRFNSQKNSYDNLQFKPLPREEVPQPKRHYLLGVFFAISITIAIVSLVYNIFIFKEETHDFHYAMNSLSEQISKVRVNSSAKIDSTPNKTTISTKEVSK